MKKIEQNLFQQYQFLSELKANETNSKVGFLVSKINEKTDSYDKSLYLYDDVTVTKFKDGVDSFIFDGNNILVKKVEKFKTKFTRFDLNGEVLKEFTLPVVAVTMKKLEKSGSYLFVCKTDVNCSDYYKLSEQEQEIYETQVAENKFFHILDEYPYYFNAAGYVNKTRKSLFLYDETTDTLTKITKDTVDVNCFDVYQDEILYAGKDFTAYKGFDSQVYLYNVETNTTQGLYEKNDLWITRIFYKDGKAFVGGTKGLRHGYTEHPIFYALKGNDELEVIVDPDMGQGNSTGSDCRYGTNTNYVNYKGKPYFIATNQANGIVFSFEGNEVEHVINITGSTDALAFLNGKMITIGLYDMRLQEIYCVEDGAYTRISSFNEFVKEEYYVADPIAHSIKQADYDVDGFVLLPYNYDPSKKYPLILDIHGGPKTAYSPIFYHEMQMWTSMGYFVIYCNPKGSDGKGNFFTNIRGGIYGSGPFDDLMKFTDSILEQYPAIDEKRMAVTGGSYGGYMTNYVITHTDRFACAASQRSISNWISMATSSDCGVDFPIKMKVKDVRDCHDELWDCSPLKYANNVVTPTLFIHSLEDYRCPFTEALQLYTAIKLNGVDSRLCAFEGENHELSRSGKPKARRKRLEEINNWILKYTQVKE